MQLVWLRKKHMFYLPSHPKDFIRGTALFCTLWLYAPCWYVYQLHFHLSFMTYVKPVRPLAADCKLRAE